MKKPYFKKHKYIKVFTYDDKKRVVIDYHKIENFKPNYLINPDHIFNSNGFQSIVTTNKCAETINPLDFKSQYKADDFKVAIESKVIKDAFGDLKVSKIDLVKVMLFVNIGINVILLYILIKANGGIA